MNKLIKFIKENELTFNEGERNTNIVVLVGFALFCTELNDDEFNEESVLEAIEKSGVEWEDLEFIDKEIYRVWEYAYEHSYENYWQTPAAKEEWKFDEVAV